jgi:hypothetical protein
MKKTFIIFFLSLAIVGCKNEKLEGAAGGESKSHKSKTKRTFQHPSDLDQLWKSWGLADKRRNDLDRESIEQNLKDLSNKRYSPDRRLEFELMIGELASRDPEAALAYFVPEKMRVDEPGFMFVASLLAKTAPDILKKWLEDNLKNGSLDARTRCLSSALEAMANTDAASTWEFYSKGEWNGAGTISVTQSLFQAWARQSYVNAELAAERAFKGEDYDSVIYSILTIVKSSDPEAAMKMALKIGGNAGRANAFYSTISTWLDLNPDAAMERLKSFSAPELQAVLNSGFSGITEWSIVDKLARSDSNKLISLIQTLVPSASNEKIFDETVLALSTHSPDRVNEFLDTLPDGELKTRLFTTQITTLIRENPNAIAEQIIKLKDENSKLEAYRIIGDMANAESYEATLSAVGRLSDLQKTTFIAAALPRVSQTAPKKAAAMLTANEIPIEDNRRNGLISTVAIDLARDDLSYAEQWMKSLPDDQQPFAMRGIAESIARKDIKDLSEKLAGMERDKNWAAGVNVLIENIKSSDPAMAKSWQDALDAQEKR